MSDRIRRSVAAVVLVAAAGVGTLSCDEEGRPHEPAPQEPAISDTDAAFVLDFDSAQVRGDRIVAASATGVDLAVEVVTAGAGQVRAGADAAGGIAARFPDPEAAARGDLAALAVTPAGDTDTLTPGDHDFAFGMDVQLPETVDQGAGTDDGDNLMQRGLFGGSGQFKLQVDGGRPSCRVAGDEGEALVKATGVLDPGQWYRLRCERVGDRVDLFVGTLDASGSVTWEGWSKAGKTGDIGPGTPPATMSVAAKLNPEGELVLDSPDQFSGLLDRVLFAVED